MKENRIVLPIPPGKHWSDELPFVLPGQGLGIRDQGLETKALEGNAPKARKARAAGGPKLKVAPPKRKTLMSGGLRFAPARQPPAAVEPKPALPKPKRERPPRQKNDPKLVAAAREFRDRYLEEVNTGRMLPAAWGASKYDVSRALIAGPTELRQMPPPHPLTAA